MDGTSANTRSESRGPDAGGIPECSRRSLDRRKVLGPPEGRWTAGTRTREVDRPRRGSRLPERHALRGAGIVWGRVFRWSAPRLTAGERTTGRSLDRREPEWPAYWGTGVLRSTDSK